jgi:hypothetical protein
MVPLSLIFFNVPVNSCAIAGATSSALDIKAAASLDRCFRFIMSGAPRIDVKL